MLLLQEPKLFANVPPLGLHTCFFHENSTPGIRGLICSPAVAWLHALSITHVPSTDIVMWVILSTSLGDIYVANVYFPPGHEDRPLVLAALDALESFVQSLTPGTLVIICGDLNCDPHPKKMLGDLATVVSGFIQRTGLILANRPCLASSYTRPASGKHIDHFIYSASLKRHVCAPLEYFHDNKLGSSTGRAKSDHSPIVLTITGGNLPRHSYSKILHFNTQLLRDGHTHNYHTAMRSLIEKWTQWRLALLCESQATPTLLRLLWAGLMFCIHEGAYIALGYSINWRHHNGTQPLSLQPAPHTVGRHMWRYMRNQKRALQPTQHSFSTEATLAHMLRVANDSITPAVPSVSALVAQSNQSLPRENTLDQKERLPLIRRWSSIMEKRGKALRDGSSAGPLDRSPPELVKHSPREL